MASVAHCRAHRRDWQWKQQLQQLSTPSPLRRRRNRPYMLRTDAHTHTHVLVDARRGPRLRARLLRRFAAAGTCA